MATINNSNAERMKKLAKKSEYIKRVWKTDASSKLTLQEYIDAVEPLLAHMKGEPEIIAKKRKSDGKTFLKMLIPLKGGAEMEFDISYEDNEFEEGDIIDPATLEFYIETFMEDEHLYVTGEVLE